MPSADEIKLAAQYIEALTKKFDPDEYHDEYRETLKALIRVKAEGEEIVLPAPKTPAKVVSLTEALRQSIQQVRKPPAKAAADSRGRGARPRPRRARKAA